MRMSNDHIVKRIVEDATTDPPARAVSYIAVEPDRGWPARGDDAATPPARWTPAQAEAHRFSSHNAAALRAAEARAEDDRIEQALPPGARATKRRYVVARLVPAEDRRDERRLVEQRRENSVDRQDYERIVATTLVLFEKSLILGEKGTAVVADIASSLKRWTDLMERMVDLQTPPGHGG